MRKNSFGLFSCLKVGENMPNESAKEQLIAKAQKQYIDFVDELKKHDKDYIIENAYKMLKMQDILSILEEGGLSDEKYALLLQVKYPLEQLYYEWMSSGLNENYEELRLVLNEYLQKEERSMEEQTEQTEKIEILVVEPMIKPYKAVIDNTLDAMQKVVGGYIELIYLDDVAVVVNEEGKINGSPLNRSLYETAKIDIAAGTFSSAAGGGQFWLLNAGAAEKICRGILSCGDFLHQQKVRNSVA